MCRYARGNSLRNEEQLVALMRQIGLKTAAGDSRASCTPNSLLQWDQGPELVLFKLLRATRGCRCVIHDRQRSKGEQCSKRAWECWWS